jgi:hypothetical protein
MEDRNNRELFGIVDRGLLRRRRKRKSLRTDAGEKNGGAGDGGRESGCGLGAFESGLRNFVKGRVCACWGRRVSESVWVGERVFLGSRKGPKLRAKSAADQVITFSAGDGEGLGQKHRSRKRCVQRLVDRRVWCADESDARRSHKTDHKASTPGVGEYSFGDIRE